MIMVGGCASHYGPLGQRGGGGHDMKRMSGDVFKVGFFGNSFTEPKKIRDFSMLKAAEVTLDYKFTHFEILGADFDVNTSVADMPDTATTRGTASVYGGSMNYSSNTTIQNNGIIVQSGQNVLTIRCYVGDPGGHTGPLHDAAKIKSEIRAKYEL